MTKDEVNNTVLSLLLSEMMVADEDVDSPEIANRRRGDQDIHL